MKDPRGLLLDPFNGVADIELKVIRILHNYSFLEDPSRLIRATRFAARFHWLLEERTQARYDAAKEGKYIDHILRTSIGHEIAALAHEDDPLHVVKTLEKEGWLTILHDHWTLAKVDVNGITSLMKTRQQMVDMGYAPDADQIRRVMYFLTSHFLRQRSHGSPEDDPAQGPGRSLARHPKITRRLNLAKRLMGKEKRGKRHAHLAAAVNRAPGDGAVPRRQRRSSESVEQKIKNYSHQVASSAAEDSRCPK